MRSYDETEQQDHAQHFGIRLFLGAAFPDIAALDELSRPQLQQPEVVEDIPVDERCPGVLRFKD